jgi:hypothetical protein
MDSVLVVLTRKDTRTILVIRVIKLHKSQFVILSVHPIQRFVGLVFFSYHKPTSILKNNHNLKKLKVESLKFHSITQMMQLYDILLIKIHELSKIFFHQALIGFFFIYCILF